MYQLFVYCAYCKAFLRTKDGQGQSGVSHGICRPCFDTEIEKLKNNRPSGKYEIYTNGI